MLLKEEWNNDIYFNLFALKYNQAIFHQVNNVLFRIFKPRVSLKSATEEKDSSFNFFFFFFKENLNPNGNNGFLKL